MKNSTEGVVDGKPVEISNQCGILLALWKLAEANED